MSLRPFVPPPVRWLSCAIALAVTTGAFGVALEACSGDGSSGTTGRRVRLQTMVEVAPAAEAPFTNALGWTITLSKALVSIGPLYYFDGEPLFSRRPELLRALSPKRAWAHPGHYVPGDAKGEMTVASSVDLLAGPTALASGEGVSGAYRSARFTFGAPPVGPHAAALAGQVVVVAGEATNGEATVRFTASADATDVADAEGAPIVEGCVLRNGDVQADGTVTLTIEPTVWLDQVDFAGMPQDAETALAGVARDGFVRGLKKGSAYVFSYAR